MNYTTAEMAFTGAHSVLNSKHVRNHPKINKSKSLFNINTIKLWLFLTVFSQWAFQNEQYHSLLKTKVNHLNTMLWLHTDAKAVWSLE
jgi:hypothetical protein